MTLTPCQGLGYGSRPLKETVNYLTWRNILSIELNPIGKVKVLEESLFSIEIAPQYRPGLLNLKSFSHINVLFWCHKCDRPEARTNLQMAKPYINAPEAVGIFATRSPVRPNPLGLTAVEVLDLDESNGLIKIAYIDADDETPVVDLKPYTPSLDRVRAIQTPEWCAHWPKWQEDSASFDWQNEFTD